MLKYSVKLTDKDFKDNNIVWREKYVAPDLSYISGVTDFSCHLEKHPYMTVENPSANQSNILKVESEVVTRLGYVILKDKEYPVKKVNGINYVQINDRFFYESGGKFTIKDWLCESFVRKNGKIVPNMVEKDVSTTASGGKIKLDTICWIEDGFVTIDGVEYIFDPNEQQSDGTVGCLKFKNDGRVISKPCECSSVYFAPFTDVSFIHEVCKFKAYSTPYLSYKFTDIKYCEYFFFAKYKEHYCPVRLNDSNFVCEVPLGGDISSLTDYQVYAHSEDGDGEFEVNTSVDGVHGINDLLFLDMFIKLEGEEFPINYDYRASNSSKYIMVRMENQTISVPVGETISFVDSSLNECNIDVESGTVLYDGKKYYVEDGLFDKAKIDGTEYDVTYDDLDSTIAYVTIDGEQVPMKRNGNTLTRYGYVLKSGESVISEESYTIKKYSGVTIDGVAYLVKDNVAYVGKSNKIKFIVTDIKGNSLYICTPYLNPNEYSDSYINSKASELCFIVVGNKENFDFQVDNKVFGLQTVSKESVFGYTDNPTSSDDIYNVFEYLKINGDNGYINLPITFTSARGNNMLQSDTIKKDFCEKEKEKAINKIVDLEKDVYAPKILLDKKYVGSSSKFQSVHTINVSLHFRTRNLENWKVNEGYNDISVSGTADNWFITDYEPYKTMITATTTTDKQRDTMMRTSDLLGFLNFDNNDVFYQKSRIAKSFLRFTFYDSCDPQTQSLLATSSVFLNEHDLYKKFIDNSRKGVHDYLQFALTMDETLIANKIRVTTERMATSKEYDDTNPPKDIIKINRPEGEPPVDTDRYISLKEDARLSSRFVIDNKYSTDTSSEGFYIYIFREYAEKLHPKRIYMKIEFNHAGIGKTIPFIVPMKWTEKNDDNEVYPERRVTLSNKVETQEQGEETPTALSDLDYLKQGYPLSWVYSQSYIPLYAVYDFKNKEYGYVFDKRYVTENNGVIDLNLFEIKIKNDEDPTTNEGTAIIDANDQFN